MPEAWQVRGYQRQQLLEKSMKAVCEEEDKRIKKGGMIAKEDFLWNLVLVTASYLKESDSLNSSWVIDNDNRLEAGRFFVHNVLRPVVRFGRSDSEKRVLFCDFLEKVLSHTTQSDHTSLGYEEMAKPQKIFKASSAMDEVDLENA